MGKSILESLFDSVNGIEVKTSSKGQSSVYRKELFAKANTLDDGKKIRRVLRKNLDNRFSEFLVLAKTKNVKAIESFVADFAKYYKETYVVNNYEISSLTKKVEEKSENWRNVMGLLLQLTKEYDHKAK